MPSADTLLDQVRQRLERAEKHVTLAEGLCGRAAQHGDVRTAVAAVQAAVAANREARGVLELQAKLQGQLAEQAALQVNIASQQTMMVDTDLDITLCRGARLPAAYQACVLGASAVSERIDEPGAPAD